MLDTTLGYILKSNRGYISISTRWAFFSAFLLVAVYLELFERICGDDVAALLDDLLDDDALGVKPAALYRRMDASATDLEILRGFRDSVEPLARHRLSYI